MSVPVFVVGLPRSGSTLLSRVLNESADILSVNDLYYLQAVFANEAVDGALGGDVAARLLDALLDVLVTRGSANSAFIGQFELSATQATEIRSTVLAEHAAQPLDWAGLMGSTLILAAETVGKTRWADKTPQNFMHMELLREAFPGCRFIFLLRDPRSTLVSFKYAAGPGHDPRRYHPLVYALYWRTAARCLLAEQQRDDVFLLRFEELLADVSGVADRLGHFLESSIAPPDLARVGDNSSFKGTRRKPLTETEIWLVQRLCAKEMESLGYASEAVSIRMFDLPEMVWLSLRFALFQTGRLLFSKDGRTRIFMLARRMLRSG